MTLYPLDHLVIEHNYAGTSWQDFTGDLVSANVVLREFAGTHTCAVSFYNAAMDPATGTDTHVMKRGDKVRVWMNNAAGTSRKTGTFLVKNIQTAIDLSKPPGRTHKVTATLVGAGFAGVAGSGQSKGVDSLVDLSDIITGAPFEINGNGLGSGRTTAIGTSTEVATVDTASELDQLLLTRDSNPGTIMFEDPNGAIQIFDQATARTGAAAYTIGPDKYSKIDVAFDASHVINVLAIKYLQKIKPAHKPTRVVEHDFKFEDSASIVKFGHQKKTITVHNKIDFADYADRVFANNADPVETPRSVTIPIRTAADLLPGYEDGTYVGGKVTVIHPDGVGAYSCRVERIVHQITPARWTVQVFLRNPNVIQRPLPETSAMRTEVANNPDATVLTAHMDDNAVDTRVLAPESVDGTHLAPEIDATGVEIVGGTVKGGTVTTGDVLPRVLVHTVGAVGVVGFQPKYTALPAGHGTLDGDIQGQGSWGSGAGNGQLILKSPAPPNTALTAFLDQCRLVLEANEVFGPNAALHGALEVTGDLDVTGQSTLDGDLDVTGDLDVAGVATLHDDLNVTGDLVANTLNVGGHTIGGLDFGHSTATTNATALLTINHSLGVTPTAVILTSALRNQIYRVSAVTSTNFQIQSCKAEDNTLLASTAVDLHWLALA